MCKERGLLLAVACWGRERFRDEEMGAAVLVSLSVPTPPPPPHSLKRSSHYLFQASSSLLVQRRRHCLPVATRRPLHLDSASAVTSHQQPRNNKGVSRTHRNTG
ncbi:hypothetical protein BS78_02G333000 [Paspalum vaginatum]|nr:hypothetical protein BS78_02G333000 [Paspalum vaginatum]